MRAGVRVVFPASQLSARRAASTRPHRASTGQDRFLELNLTAVKIVFTRINGPIPNRGLAMPDIDMFGVTYLQQISEAADPTAGLHIEPGIWANVPKTSDPTEPHSVVRMASIPHGTVMLAQGVWQIIPGGPQHIPDNNILSLLLRLACACQRRLPHRRADLPRA